MKNQPSRLAPPSVTNIGTDNAVARAFAAEAILLRTWGETVRLCAAVAAHGTRGGQLPECDELLDTLEAAEEAIMSSVPNGTGLLDQLAGWEASLLHVGDEVSPTHFLVCRRAQAIPDDMPTEYAWALRVMDEAS